MKRHRANIRKSAFPRISAYLNLIQYSGSYLHQTGWMESVRRGYPCKCDGSELPWMNYSIISVLEQRLQRDFALFEYGSGYSTIFYSRMVGEVVSVEHNREWFARIRTKVPANVTVMYRELDEAGAYAQSIHSISGAFDVIVVDGRDRVNCVKQAVDRLSECGVLLLDDSRRERYAEVFQIMAGRGFRFLDFDGLKPAGLIIGRTTVFYRDNNCLGI